MTRFTFTVNVSVAGTSHQAKTIQESMIEALEEWSIEQSNVIAKVRGMSLEVTTVKQVKEAQLCGDRREGG